MPRIDAAAAEIAAGTCVICAVTATQPSHSHAERAKEIAAIIASHLVCVAADIPAPEPTTAAGRATLNANRCQAWTNRRELANGTKIPMVRCLKPLPCYEHSTAPAPEPASEQRASVNDSLTIENRLESFLAILMCSTHYYYAVAIEDKAGDGTRLTPSKCCGSWKTLKRWPLNAQMRKQPEEGRSDGR